jgi:hypothetical protein
MYITIKVGSEITLPFGSVNQLTTANPGVLSVIKTGPNLTIRALSVGDVELVCELGTDFRATLTVKVVS